MKFSIPFFHRRIDARDKSRKALGIAGVELPSVSISYSPITATRDEASAIAAEAVAKALAIPAPAEPFSVAKHHRTVSTILKALEAQAALLKKEADDEARSHIVNTEAEAERHKKAVKDEADRHSGVIETLVRKTTEIEQLQEFYSTGFDKLAAMVGDRVIGEPPAPAGDFKPSDVAIPKRTARQRNRKPVEYKPRTGPVIVSGGEKLTREEIANIPWSTDEQRQAALAEHDRENPATE